MQAKGVRIVAIGIGEYEKFEGQLEEIAGENVYSATNFNQLSDMFAEILKETCSKSPTHTVYPRVNSGVTILFMIFSR